MMHFIQAQAQHSTGTRKYFICLPVSYYSSQVPGASRLQRRYKKTTQMPRISTISTHKSNNLRSPPKPNPDPEHIREK